MFGLGRCRAYLTPLICGFISDALMTRSQAVILGAAFCAAGQMLFGFAPTFLIGLFLVLAGAGLVGVNIATQLGDLYARSKADSGRRLPGAPYWKQPREHSRRTGVRRVGPNRCLALGLYRRIVRHATWSVRLRRGATQHARRTAPTLRRPSLHAPALPRATCKTIAGAFSPLARS